MSLKKANLIYSVYDEKKEEQYVNLENSNLFLIDDLTSRYKDNKELIKDPKYKEIIDSFLKKKRLDQKGDLKLYYINSEDSKEELKIIFNDNQKLDLVKDISNKKLTEFEKARKLLWSSKNNMFLKLFLHNKRILDTTFFNIKIESNREYKFFVNNHVNLNEYYGSLYVKVNDLLILRSKMNNTKELREIYEATLEEWKKNIEENFSIEEKYYYARELKLIKRKYDLYLNKKDLKINNLKLNKINFNNYKFYHNRFKAFKDI